LSDVRATRLRRIVSHSHLAGAVSATASVKSVSPDRLDALVWALSDLLLRTPSRPSVKSLN
ncbi:MAG: hypothetical protein AAFQ96_02005, partial [Pseudomonadota bacterium]